MKMPKVQPHIDPERVAIGERLQKARNLAGLSQDSVGREFGKGKGTVSAWETGRGAPDIYKLRKLCAMYKVSADEILGLKDPVWPFKEVDQYRYEQLDAVAQAIAQTRMTRGFPLKCNFLASMSNFV